MIFAIDKTNVLLSYADFIEVLTLLHPFGSLHPIFIYFIVYFDGIERLLLTETVIFEKKRKFKYILEYFCRERVLVPTHTFYAASS